MKDRERLEEFLKIIDELTELNLEVPVIVEGKKDVKALRALGLKGDIFTLNHGIPIFNLCEEIAMKNRKVIILTDWDSRGGRLAKALREGFRANAVAYDDKLRARLVRICKKEGKDVEALPTLLEALRKRIGLSL